MAPSLFHFAFALVCLVARGRLLRCPYEVLRVARKTPTRRIVSAFRKQARIAHADKGGSDELFRELMDAKEFIVNGRTRCMYDAYIYQGYAPKAALELVDEEQKKKRRRPTPGMPPP
jgi:DnaJ-class molecular chaperone